MKLTGTVLGCSSRKVNSSSKETYVTNLLVLDPENSSGTNYAVEVWEDKPRQEAPMSEVALTVVGVVSKNGGVPAETSRGGSPSCGNSGCGVGCYRCRRAERGRRILDEIRRQRPRRNHPLYHSVYDPPSRVALEGGS